MDNVVVEDDWGDFSAAIAQLEQQDTTEDTQQVVESEDRSEAVSGLLEVAFSFAEQATGIISGVDFEFDEKGKRTVIDAAVPVFDKHGDKIMALFGSYIEEATLLLAVLGLAYGSKRKLAKMKQQGEGRSEETKATTVTKSDQ